MLHFKRLFVFILSGLCVLVLFMFVFQFKISASADMGYNPNYIYSVDTNCDNPSSISALIDKIELNAIDNNGDEIDVSRISVNDAKDYYDNVLNQPNGASRRLGTYNIRFRCYDNYGNYGDFLLKVNVIDTTAPTVDTERSKLVYVFNRKEINNYTYNMIYNGIVASDNHDYLLIKEFVDDDIDLSKEFGVNTYGIIIKDNSGNQTIVNVEIEIIDNVGPKVEAARTYLRLEASNNIISDSELIEDYFKIEALDEEENQMILVEAIENEYISADDLESYKNGMFARIAGTVIQDNYSKQVVLDARAIELLPPPELRDDPEENKRVELHLHTKMSTMDGVSNIEQYCELAEHMGHKAIAITDHFVGNFRFFYDFCRDFAFWID